MVFQCFLLRQEHYGGRVGVSVFRCWSERRTRWTTYSLAELQRTAGYAIIRAKPFIRMQTKPALCPGCKYEVVFQTLGPTRICPVCGFQYEQSSAMVAEPRQPSAGMEFLVVLGKAVLVVIALGAAGIGLLFAGCIVLSRGFH